MMTMIDLQPEYILDGSGKKKAVILSMECITALLERLNRYQAEDDWDEQIGRDAEAGKLDFLLDAAQRDYDAGKLHFR